MGSVSEAVRLFGTRAGEQNLILQKVIKGNHRLWSGRLLFMARHEGNCTKFQECPMRQPCGRDRGGRVRVTGPVPQRLTRRHFSSIHLLTWHRTSVDWLTLSFARVLSPWVTFVKV